MTMKAVLFYAPKQIRLVSVPVPEPGPGEVLIKVGAALTCGTDFKAYRQGHRVLLGEPPSPFGHELAGTVVGCGEGVEGFPPGTRVVAANSAPCDRCFFCRRGQSQLCLDLRLHNGAYAEYNLVPAQIVKHNLWRLGPSLNFKEAALAEPLACAIHAVETMRVEAGETVALLGAGNMALLIAQALKARGARVIAIGRDRARLARAGRAGAHVVSALEDDPKEAVMDLTQGLGADCVFEAVGKAETWRQALTLVRKGGKVCLFGGCASGTEVPMDAHRVHYEQLWLQGVFHHTPLYFRKAVDLLASGAVDAGLLIESSIRLDEVPDYFARTHKTSQPKAAVIP